MPGSPVCECLRANTAGRCGGVVLLPGVARLSGSFLGADGADGAVVGRVDRARCPEGGSGFCSLSPGERKDERTRERLRDWDGREGVLYIGKAQERARVVRTERRHDPATGAGYPWLVPSTAMLNQYYLYVFDDDFGPLFLKFCSYFPFNAKLCLNGHEYLKRQLTKRGIGFEELDNGILNCDDPGAMQAIAREITASKIDTLFRKWLARLPHPFSARDWAAGIRYDLSILQAEFALTQVFDRPLHGRVFFEDIHASKLTAKASAVNELMLRRAAQH